MNFLGGWDCTGCLYILFTILPSLPVFAVVHCEWNILPPPLTLTFVVFWAVELGKVTMCQLLIAEAIRGMVTFCQSSWGSILHHEGNMPPSFALWPEIKTCEAHPNLTQSLESSQIQTNTAYYSQIQQTDPWTWNRCTLFQVMENWELFVMWHYHGDNGCLQCMIFFLSFFF